MEQVTESGKGQLRSVAGEVNNELQSIEASNTAYGDALVTEELEKALGDFDEKKAALLNNVKEQRDIIQAEVSKIESLAKDLKALDKKSTKAARRKDLCTLASSEQSRIPCAMPHAMSCVSPR